MVATVTRQSDALDLEEGTFKSGNPDAIARSLKRSAETSHSRKASPYRSAMSMRTFYMNRAGKNLADSRCRTLERAKIRYAHSAFAGFAWANDAAPASRWRLCAFIDRSVAGRRWRDHVLVRNRATALWLARAEAAVEG